MIINLQKIKLKGFRDLKVYQIALKLAMEIYEITKTFSPEEKYDDLTANSEEIGKLSAYMMNNPEKFNKLQFNIKRETVDCQL